MTSRTTLTQRRTRQGRRRRRGQARRRPLAAPRRARSRCATVHPPAPRSDSKTCACQAGTPVQSMHGMSCSDLR